MFKILVYRRSPRIGFRSWRIADYALEGEMRTNSADDRSAAVVSGRSVLGVELGEPLNSSPSSVQMIQSVRHDCMRLIGSKNVCVLWCEVLRSFNF
jgi:hypothetical protein